jgi:hypothetical protein
MKVSASTTKGGPIVSEQAQTRVAPAADQPAKFHRFVAVVHSQALDGNAAANRAAFGALNFGNNDRDQFFRHAGFPAHAAKGLKTFLLWVFSLSPDASVTFLFFGGSLVPPGNGSLRFTFLTPGSWAAAQNATGASPVGGEWKHMLTSVAQFRVVRGAVVREAMAAAAKAFSFLPSTIALICLGHSQNSTTGFGPEWPGGVR